MPQKIITDLTLIDAVTAELSVPADNSITTYRFTIAQLLEYIEANIQIDAPDIEADAVTTSKILDQNVTLGKLKDDIMSGLTAVTPQGVDYLTLVDASDSNKTKKVYVDLIKNAVYRAVTTTDAVGVNDETMKLSGVTFTSTLPTAVGATGKRYKFIHAGTSLTQVYTLATTSSQTIGGVASGSYKLVTAGEVLQIESDGANWIIVDHKTNTDWVSAGAIVSFYTFTVAAGSYSATAGAIYTNNGNSYVVATTFTTAATSIVFVGTAAPSATGTLTYVSGTHVGNPIFSAVSGAASLISGTTSQPAFWTSPTTNVVQWRRQGSTAIINYNFNQGSAGTVAGSGDQLWAFPANIVADVTKTIAVYTGSVGTNLLGVAAAQLASIPTTGGIGNSTSASFETMAYLFSSTQVRFGNYSYSGAVAGGNFSSSYFPATNNPLYFNITITIPVADWQP